MSVVRDLVESGRIRPHIEREFELKDIVTAHEHYERGGSNGKVVIRDRDRSMKSATLRTVAGRRAARSATPSAPSLPEVSSVPRDVRAYTPPPPDQMRRFFRLARWYFNPEFLGLWELDLKRPALFVGNHTLYGLSDAPLMIEHLYTHYGVVLRGLGDRGHFRVPGWGKFLARHGMVLGTPENCSALMKAGQYPRVPGRRARRSCAARASAYRLIWKQRTAFARIAIEHGYDIIPFGSVGPDESYNRVRRERRDAHARMEVAFGPQQDRGVHPRRRHAAADNPGARPDCRRGHSGSAFRPTHRVTPPRGAA